MELRHRLELSIGGGPAIEMITGQPKFLMSDLGHLRKFTSVPREGLLWSAISIGRRNKIRIVFCCPAG